MQHGLRCGARAWGFIGLLTALGVFASSALASQTNVFIVKDSLQAGAPTGSGIEVLTFKAGSDPLLGTNFSSTVLAVAVMDTDCRLGGLDPSIRLVAFNQGTGKIAATLVEFTTVSSIFVGDDQLVLEARGEGRSGVEAADLEALITFGYEPCTSTNSPTDPTSVEIRPLGFIRPTGSPGFTAPILPDFATLEITAEDGTEISVPLSGQGTTPTLICNIDVGPTNLSFGNVNVGDNAVQTFTIRNNGGSTCVVSNITRNGSSAFAISAPGTPFNLAPGASAPVTVTFSPTVTGADSAVILVTSSDTNQFVNVSGNGVVTPSPCVLNITPLVLNFGSTEIGTNKSLNVTLTNSGGTTCTVDVVTLVTNNVGFSFSPSQPVIVPPGTSTVVTVTFTPTDTSAITGTLEFDTLNPTNLVLVSLSASGEVARCHLDVDPTSINFGGVAVGGSRTQSVTLANTGVTNCTINSLSISNAAFALLSPPSTPFDIAPSASTNLDIEFAPTDNGTTNGTLSIESDKPVMTNTVALTGLGVIPVSECSILAFPDSFPFGDVGVGKTNVLKTTVSNVGLSNCVINAITFTGSNDFTLVAPPTPINLAPNGFVEVGVRYVPSDVGSDAGIVSIVSEDQSNTVIALPVSGNGVQCALTISSTDLAFGDVPVSSNRTLSATVTNISTVSCTINSISISGSGDFSLDPIVPTSQFILQAGETVEVPVVYTPSDQGVDNGTLRIVSDDPNSPLEAALSGTGLQCNLSVSPTSIDFGTVALGRTNTVTLSIQNSGNTNCVVESLEILGSGRFEFVAPATPFVVGAGTNVDIDVEFLPINVETIVILGGSLKASGKPIVVSP